MSRVQKPQIKGGGMIKNIWVEIKGKSIKMILLLTQGRVEAKPGKQPFQREEKNGQSHPDIDHRSGKDTKARCRGDEGWCLSRPLREVSQQK